LFALIAAPALAQSAISGVVRDTSGAVLPGVTVDAASPALIEKVRTNTTDEQGRYSIVDLRPGTYKVTFTLPGFATVVRDGIELPANFAATINADMQVGSLEETINVSAGAPLVDVRSAGHSEELQREVLDALPTARTFITEGALAVGVKINAQNVGGARYASQQRMILHGNAAKDNTVSIDGMKMNTGLSGGETQPNHNDAMAQEVTILTSAPSAEVSGGGVYINIIPKDGGNQIKGDGFFGYSGHSFQADNLTDDLRAQGIKQSSAIQRIYDLNSSIGGPLKKDKIWFFGSQRLIGNASVITDSYYADGRPGIYDQRLQNYTARLTAQFGRHKLTAFNDRAFKIVWHDFTAGTDPATAAGYWPPVLYYTGAVKYTGTLSNKLLVEGGVGAAFSSLQTTYQPGIQQPRGTPAWYTIVQHQDLQLNTKTVAGSPTAGQYPSMYMAVGSVSYVTGSHAFKTGGQWRFGGAHYDYNANGDLIQRYQNGSPDSVIVYNTPVTNQERLNADLGIYAQDSWTIERLTLNPGVRLEYFDSSILSTNQAPGRFIGSRSFSGTDHIPQWFDVAPRLTGVFDVTGDAKTAIRVGINKYMLNDTLQLTSQYDPASLSSDSRNWKDCDLVRGTSTCSGVVLPTNGDGIAEDNEIGPSTNANFGLVTRTMAAGLKRPYTVEFMASVDRQLLPKLSVSGGYYHRSWHNLIANRNTTVSLNDYTLFYATSPIDGTQVPIYNLNQGTKLGPYQDYTTSNTGQDTQYYDGVEASFRARLPKGGTAFGGWSVDRIVSVRCEGTGSIPLTGAEWSATWDPNTTYNCDQSKLGMPFRHDFKFNAAYPVGKGVQVGAVLQSYAGGMMSANWAVPANVFPNGQRTQAVMMNLYQPGTRYLPRWNQLDLSLKREFKLRRMSFTTSVDMFNALNVSTILAVNSSYGPTLNRPTEILQPRVLRLSTNVHF
jgi:hypothetical protein